MNRNDLHLLVQSKCHRVPLYDTIEELNNPTGILAEDARTNLKPFDLKAAKAGKPVCTRDRRKARIICFDKQDERPIIALIQNNNREDVYYYHTNGVNFINNTLSDNDLMLLSEKKEGWVNVYKIYDDCRNVGGLYSSKEEAEKTGDNDCIATVKVEWEE